MTAARRIVLFGGSGQVGSELRTLTWPEGFALLSPTRREVDIGDRAAVAALLAAGDIAAVINTAAWTAVDAAEDARDEAHRANALGPAVLAEETRRVQDDLTRFAAERGAEFVLEAEPGAAILGHRLTYALALRNLLVNAVKHSPGPVRVVIKVRRGRRHHRVVVGDNGPGIPRRLQDKVFECFYSGTREGRSGGAGIGLHLVRHNVENLGGRVELVSEEGQGSTFTMILPAADDANG